VDAAAATDGAVALADAAVSDSGSEGGLEDAGIVGINDNSGCSCNTTGSSTSELPGVFALAGLALAGLRRRRASRA
jgi:MYXO-CTERM domain-containing protein